MNCITSDGSHKYHNPTGEIGQTECEICGLLKSTIEHSHPKQSTELEEILGKMRELYLTKSPDDNGLFTKTIIFNWGKFIFETKGVKAEFYLATKDIIEEFVSKAYQSGHTAGQAAEREKFGRMVEGLKVGSPRQPGEEDIYRFKVACLEETKEALRSSLNKD